MPPTLYIASEDRVITVNDGVTRIGRSMTADVELEDWTVSRRHALIVHGDGQSVLLDDGSRNGTWLNGERVERAALQRRRRDHHRPRAPALRRGRAHPRVSRFFAWISRCAFVRRASGSAGSSPASSAST